MMHPALFLAFLETASWLARRSVELRLSQPYHKQARGACYMDASTGKTVIQVRPSLWDEDRNQFWSVYLHEVAHARLHAMDLKPSDGKTMPPDRSSTVRGVALGVKDSLDELRADTQMLQWSLFAGKGSMMERLFRLQKWQKE